MQTMCPRFQKVSPIRAHLDQKYQTSVQSELLVKFGIKLTYLAVTFLSDEIHFKIQLKLEISNKIAIIAYYPIIVWCIYIYQDCNNIVYALNVMVKS